MQVFRIPAPPPAPLPPPPTPIHDNENPSPPLPSSSPRPYIRYDWSPGALADGVFDASLAQGLVYIPMIWGEQDLSEERVRHLAWIGDNAPFLLGFNEPNFKSPQVKNKKKNGSCG